MVSRVLWILFLIISLAFAGIEKLDYQLRQLVKESPGTLKAATLKVRGLGEVGEVKILRKNGKVEVVDLSKRSLEDLMKDPDVVYIEAPRPVELKNDIVNDTSYGLYGTGSKTISITDPGRTYWVYITPYGSVSSYPSCSYLGVVLDSDLLECSGDTSIEVSASGDFRMVVAGAELNNISGYTEAYLVGTKSLNTTNDGRGVIVGVIDSGINFCHPAFLDSNGNTRVKFFGFMTDQQTCQSVGGAYDPNTEICEFNETVINQKINTGDCQWDNVGHGTHVSGTAAGSDPFIFGRGIAPGADLIVFSLITSSPNYQDPQLIDTLIIRGLEWIKNKAQELGEPAVVNMSLGKHYDDPHDGTGLLDRKVDEVSGPGFVVVVAQGNEGSKPIHAFTTRTSDTVRIRVPEGIAAIVGWYENPSQWNIEVCEPNTSNCVGVQSGSDMPSLQTIGNTGCQAQVLASMTEDPLNGDGRFEILTECESSRDLEIRLSQICGDVARVDMWALGGNFLTNYDQDSLGGYKFTVDSPGTAKRAITVGAINSRPSEWLDQWHGGTDSFSNLGKIARFSSRGPTRDGRIKPNVVAGGAWVCSANYVFPYPNPEVPSCDSSNYYVAMPGTSMATPVVTGLVALYLQSNPNATPEDVKRWLTSNAVQDVGDLQYPNVIYGYGKAVWASTVGSGGSSQDPTTAIAVGRGAGSCSAGGGGGGGCSTGSSSGLAYLIILLVVLLKRRLFS